MYITIFYVRVHCSLVTDPFLLNIGDLPFSEDCRQLFAMHFEQGYDLDRNTYAATQDSVLKILSENSLNVAVSCNKQDMLRTFLAYSP